ncbi:MAG TPA: dephospho-CoA kinase [Vicinamibacterales bacterium]|nr:dephospho-CoA kinase [Vicinamibacterales bacterium]
MNDPASAGRTRRVALTGGIATGKSHVRAAFERLGVATIDADTLARDAVAPGSAGLDAVVHRFGSHFLDSDGGLNRRALADLVFADPQARLDLEAIIHPEVRRAMDAWFASLDPAKHAVAIADIPLLYETGRAGEFDAVIVTTCHPDVQVRRIMERDRVSEAAARQRIAAQLPLEEKIGRADFVIRTDGTHAETAQQVALVLERIRRGERRT